MNRIPFPVKTVSDRIGEIQIDRDQLEQCLGPPHVAIDDYDPTEFLGPVQLWAFELANGQQVVVEFLHKEGYASVYANPPDLDAALREMGLKPGRVDHVKSLIPPIRNQGER
jgi:hypothetical protein